MSSPLIDLEANYLACLLHLDAPRVRHLEDLVTPDDLASVVYAAVLGAVHALAAQGLDPVPGAVVAELERTGAATRHRSAHVVAELYSTCTAPVMARWFGLRVLEAGLRRRVAEAGARLTQAADVESLDSLMALVEREIAAVRELAARQSPTPTPLRAVR